MTSSCEEMTRSSAELPQYPNNTTKSTYDHDDNANTNTNDNVNCTFNTRVRNPSLRHSRCHSRYSIHPTPTNHSQTRVFDDSSTQVAGPPAPVHNMGVKKSLLETLNDVAHHSDDRLHNPGVTLSL